MRIAPIAAALLVAGMTTSVAFAQAQNPAAANGHNKGAVTYALFGDWPYSDFLMANANRLLDSVNSDPAVSTIVHVGDIHSGSQACTGAGLTPSSTASTYPTLAAPGWNQAVYNIFQRFNAPFIYTPGDNEWSDCHKAKEFLSGQPARELASVRQLFFARPGHSLGLTDRQVYTQAQNFDPNFPTDAQFVENVIWMDVNTVFVTLNIPGGSNDDLDPWTAPFNTPADVAAQALDRTVRPPANLRWLDTAFATAQANNASAVVILTQADMWDTSGGIAHLSNYTPYVQSIAAHALAFGKPVLLVNGDTHLYLSDNPLADPTSPEGIVHNTPAVPNFKRIVVQGSTNDPAEWLKLTIDTRLPQPFSWTNVQYCSNPMENACN